MTNTGGIAGDHLKSFIERIERLDAEKKAIAEDLKEVYAEAKSVGIDNKIMREVIKLRKMDTHERQEKEALLDVYLHAIGFDTTPLAKAAKAAEEVSEAIDNLAELGATIEITGDSHDKKLYDSAVELVTACNKASTELIQRQLKIGYNKAAGLIEKLEESGIISKPDDYGKRTVIQQAAE